MLLCSNGDRGWKAAPTNYSKNGVQMGPVKMMTAHYPDFLVDSELWTGKTFYRLDVSGKAAGQLLSNPIFVVRK